MAIRLQPGLDQSKNIPTGSRGRVVYGEKDGGKINKKEAKVRQASTRIKGVGKIRSKELGPFTMKLSAMLDAGLPVLQCLEALEEQTDNVEFKKVCTGVYQKVEAGETFSDALACYPKIFNDLYYKMVSAGEQSGDLAGVCSKLAHYMEKSAAIKGKVKSAMMYPTVVIIIASAMTWALVTFVVPVFADMFSGLGGELPAPTKLLMTVSGIFRKQWYLVLGALAGVFYGVKAYATSKTGRMTLDRLSLTLPLFGVLVTKVVVGRISRTLASLIQSGMPILQAVQITGETAGNKYIEEAIDHVHADIENGCTITEAFLATGKFPSMLIHMIRAGEKTACIERMLEKVADFYEDEVDTALDGLSSMLEPILMVVIGSVVGSIVIAMFLPIFKIGEAVTNAN